MRTHTLPIALTLTMAPLPAVAFDENEFCTTVTDIARRMIHAPAGGSIAARVMMGLEVDCGLKALEAKRFLKADPDDMCDTTLPCHTTHSDPRARRTLQYSISCWHLFNLDEVVET